MKIIHNNKNNISVYHLLSLHIQENIEDYYLESSSGMILSNDEHVKEGEKYTIKEKCRGGTALNQSGNSFIITIGSAIIYGIVTILYYNYYITNILIGKYCNTTDIDMPNVKKIPGAFGAVPDISNKKGGAEGNNNSNNETSKLGSFQFLLKEYLKRFICNIKDSCYETLETNSFPHKKETVIKNVQTSLGSILSFAIFAVFIFMIMAPLFLNSITKIACGKPKVSSIIFAIIFIFLPLVICKLIPKIILLIECTAKKYGKIINIQNYKIAISNTLLLLMLIVYMIISKKGLSKIMFGMFPITIIVFIGIKFIPTIPNIIHSLSKWFSNHITNISPPVGDDKPEESKRYTFFYTLFEIGIFSLIGWILYTIAYIGQIKEYCSV
jgi:hypothetical protein